MHSRYYNLQRILPLLLFVAGSIFISGKLLPELPLFITDNGNKYIIMRNFAQEASLPVRHPEPALFPRGGFPLFFAINIGNIGMEHTFFGQSTF